MEKHVLGKRINQLRKKKGVTSERLAEICEVNPVHIRKVESGGSLPSLPLFLKICNALGTSSDFLPGDLLEHPVIPSARNKEEISKQMRGSEKRLFFLVLFVLLLSLIVAYNNTNKNIKLQTRKKIAMTAKEKAKLIRQTGKLYTLGITVENRREKLRRLVEKQVPYDSPQMKEALLEYQKVDEEWKRLEQEHLEFRDRMKRG